MTASPYQTVMPVMASHQIGGSTSGFAASPSQPVDVSVTHDTDLDKATHLLIDAIAAVDNVQQDPAPEVQATGFASTAISLSISYWYPSSMTSDSSVTDGVIRAVENALSEAEIELAVPLFGVERAAPYVASHCGDVEAATDDSAATPDGAQDGS